MVLLGAQDSLQQDRCHTVPNRTRTAPVRPVVLRLRRGDGDLVRDGVCGCLIARKLRVGQPTTSEHMKILCQAGLTRSKRIKKWTFYKRDETRIKQIKKAILAKV